MRLTEGEREGDILRRAHLFNESIAFHVNNGAHAAIVLTCRRRSWGGGRSFGTSRIRMQSSVGYAPKAHKHKPKIECLSTLDDARWRGSK